MNSQVLSSHSSSRPSLELGSWDWLQQPLCCVDHRGRLVAGNNMFAMWIGSPECFLLQTAFLERLKTMIIEGRSDGRRYADWYAPTLCDTGLGSEAVVLRIGAGQALLAFFLNKPERIGQSLFQRSSQGCPLMQGTLDLRTGLLLEGNEDFERVTGLPSETVFYTPIGSWPVWSQPEQWRTLVEDLKEGHPVHNRYVALNQVQGRSVTALVSMRPLPERDDLAALVIADITAKQGLVRAFIDAEARFHDLLTYAPEPTVLLDCASGFFVVANPAALEFFGYSLEKMLSLRPLDLSPEFQPDGRRSDRGVAERVGAALSGKTIDFPWVHLDAQGEPLPCHIRLVALSGNLVRASITDLRQAQRNAYELDKLSRALDQTDDMVMITDKNGCIEYVNAAFELHTGYGLDEVVGKNPALLASGEHDPAFFEEMWQTILGGGVFKGVFSNRRKDGSLFAEEKTITPITDSRQRITHFVSTGRDITEKLQIDERLNHLVNHDMLTDLPNMVSFRERLQDALHRAGRRNHQIGLIIMDLDRFKVVNDTLGHHVGDDLLRLVADRLRDAFRISDTLARLGGDEFAVLVEPVTEQGDLLPVLQKLQDLFSEPFLVQERPIYTTVSMGVCMFPNDGEDVHGLIKNADTAMFRAKKLGGNCFEIYRFDMNARAQERLVMETELRGALQRGEFHLHYQPQWDLAQRCMVGVEALIRWRHPVHGNVSPGEFVPLLEEMGLIGVVGEWILNEACRQLKQWSDQGMTSLRMAVNLSPKQFGSRQFAENVGAVLEASGLTADRLELEITEGTLMAQGDQSVNRLWALKRLGVRLAIDDFGTGYSSLAYLKRFPIDVLKIDRSFLNEVTCRREDAAIVSAILAMASSLDLEVVAEGIEEPDQLAFLRDAGCEMVQGFLLARPGAPELVEKIWRRGGGWILPESTQAG